MKVHTFFTPIYRPKDKIKHSPIWKSQIYKLIFGNGHPRHWGKWFLNPLILHHGKKAIIRQNTVTNISTVNQFRLGNRSIIEEYTVVDNRFGDVLIGNNRNDLSFSTLETHKICDIQKLDGLLVQKRTNM